MKMFFILFVNLLILILVFLVNANLDILSKFHQQEYTVALEHIELVRYNKKYLKICEVKSFRYNRTAGSIAMNLKAMFKVDLLYDGELRFQLLKFLSNEYRHFPLRYQTGFCDVLKANVFGLNYLKKFGNFTGCPLYVNKLYCISNLSFDFSQSPPGIPSGRYMMEIEYLFDNAEIAFIRAYTEVKTPIKW